MLSLCPLGSSPCSLHAFLPLLKVKLVGGLALLKIAVVHQVQEIMFVHVALQRSAIQSTESFWDRHWTHHELNLDKVVKINKQLCCLVWPC